jgi:hypothetical protein
MVVGPLGTGVGVAVGTIGVLVGVLTSVLVLVGVWVKVFVGMGVVLVVPMTYWARGASWVYAADRYPRVTVIVSPFTAITLIFSPRGSAVTDPYA